MSKQRMIRSIAGVASAAAALLVLAACGPSNVMPVPTYTPSSTATSTPSPTATPEAAPAPVPGGTAAQNRKFFDFVNSQYFATAGFGEGRPIIDNLVAAGFVKTDMELTPDETAVGFKADSIIFSVRFPDKCLIGQITASGYHSDVAPTLGTGKCLVGQTRPIDW